MSSTISLNSLQNEIDKAALCPNKGYANSFYLMSLCNDPDLIHMEIYGEKIDQRLKSIANEVKKVIQTEKGIRDAISLFDEETMKNVSIETLTTNFPSLKNFQSHVFGNNKGKKSLSSSKFMQLYLAAISKDFETLYFDMSFQDHLSYDSEKKVMEFHEKKSNEFMKEKEMSRLLQMLFTDQE